MIRYILYATVIFTVFLGGELSAQIATADSTLVPAGNDYAPSLGGIIFKLIISMILIIGLIYLSMYLIKKIIVFNMLVRFKNSSQLGI